jgi:transcriptional regulator with XRE-family HTH domain
MITEILEWGGCMRVYEKVRSYLDENHLEQASVAEKAGIPASAFNAMMNGERKMYADDLRTICYSLNVSASIFIDLIAK